MKILVILLLTIGLFALPAAAERAGDLNVQKSIVGTDPEFDATAPASPLNQFIKDVFRPDHPVVEGPTAPYEEVVPVERSYYRNEGRYYEKPPEEETLPKKEETFYKDKGRYYSTPDEK